MGPKAFPEFCVYTLNAQKEYTKTPKGAMLFGWFYVPKNLHKAYLRGGPGIACVALINPSSFVLRSALCEVFWTPKKLPGVIGDSLLVGRTWFEEPRRLVGGKMPKALGKGGGLGLQTVLVIPKK